MADEKDIINLKKRMLELAERSYSCGIYTFTPFLGLAEQQALYGIQRDIAHVGFAMEGGSPLCERKIIRFGSAEMIGYEEAYPIKCLKAEPLTPKYAEPLTHRDFLGAIMNLGIERSTVGDIFVQNKEAIVFCLESISDFLSENLTQVRHTRVKCGIVDAADLLRAPVAEELSFSVSSARTDAVISRVYGLARSKSRDLFSSGRIYVNGRLTENDSYMLKDGETVTVRGFGKFTYIGAEGETRKGKVRISVEVYK